MNKGEEDAIQTALEKILSRLGEMNTEILERLHELDQTLEDFISRHPADHHAFNDNLSDFTD